MPRYSTARILAEIEKAQAAVDANAAAAAEARNRSSYSLDTGQTRQSVMAQQLAQLTTEGKYLEERLRYWEAQLYGGTAHTSKPGW